MQRTFTLLTRTLFASLLLAGSTLHAREFQGGGTPPNPPAPGVAKADGCSPSTTVTELWVNNVRTIVETGGNMWENRATGTAFYEVPATLDQSGASALFAGGLWMGGFSPDHQLKMAAVRFRQDGNDYWPGPLTNTGNAQITASECAEWDRTWSAGKQDAIEQLAYFRCVNDPEGDCDVSALFPDGYSVPQYFYDWPAIGDVAAGQDLYIAPFLDYDEDGFYDPSTGDAPDYGLDETNQDCKLRFREDPVTLFGDSTIWWVFNDKGNAHTESGGQPIGMEIRAQAFAFATNDEVNNMTFYNYVLINQGTQTLTQTYFGQYVDPDLGYHLDDYVGCDVQRGLGYVYNGDDNDESSANGPGYGVQPPACGVDFFEGPYLDYDYIDNPLTLDCDSAREYNGIPYHGIGIGYGDEVVDNERYGMRVFMYYNNTGGALGDPQGGEDIQHYNYLRGIWRDGSHLYYGGNGHFPTDDPFQDQPALYMAPGDTDPVGWGTECIPQAPWTEEIAGNDPDDRRFIQSAGPFTLEPGAYNNITVGVVWARATSGGPFASVERVRDADDKAQSLFDNCFKILSGPDAPLLSIIELDRELVITISNPAGGNNFNEEYKELDPTIPEDAADRYYRFQGYQVYQLRDAEVSVADIRLPNGEINLELAKPVLQVDIKDGVKQLINHIYNDNMGLAVPTEMVNGADDGIVHSFSVKEDEFSGTGDPRLVNFKTYYFIALTYGYNNYAEYNPLLGEGQAYPYIAGRKSATGAIRSVSGIPHKNNPQFGGTQLNAGYGDQFQITRLEGLGNGGYVVDLEQSSVEAILASNEGRRDEITYKTGFGPVNVKVVDPLKVPSARFELWFQDSTAVPDEDPENYDDLDDAYWKLVNLDSVPDPDCPSCPSGTVRASRAIGYLNEQLIPDWGISVTIEQQAYTDNDDFAEFLEAEMAFKDPDNPWLTGIPDDDAESPFNWIRAGTAVNPAPPPPDPLLYEDYAGVDDEEKYESVLGGTWAPWSLVGDTAFQPGADNVSSTHNIAKISQSSSTLVVITPDKSKWTRCPVLEQTLLDFLAEHPGDKKLFKRSDASVDKNGLSDGQPGVNWDEATAGGTQPTGMGWFPGYAIDLVTGERMNMAFGEDSYWGGDIGRDMLWNPNDQITTQLGQPLFAGSHWIYTFNNQYRTSDDDTRMPQYDAGQFLYNNLNGSVGVRTKIFRSVGWVGSAACAPGVTMLSPQDGLVPGEVRIRLSMSKPYSRYIEPNPDYTPQIPSTDYNGGSLRNNGLPLYTFSSAGQATLTNQPAVAETSCDMIDIVPNPYYAFSGYETSRLDNRVKFINLPQVCTISIYNVSGTLVRKFRKDNDLTYLDWDLKNHVNVPIAGGVYICHIEVPNVCERVVKWFGVMRPVDLQNF